MTRDHLISGEPKYNPGMETTPAVAIAATPGGLSQRTLVLLIALCIDDDGAREAELGAKLRLSTWRESFVSDTALMCTDSAGAENWF
jgi:hypothetical protein